MAPAQTDSFVHALTAYTFECQTASACALFINQPPQKTKEQSANCTLNLNIFTPNRLWIALQDEVLDTESDRQIANVQNAPNHFRSSRTSPENRPQIRRCEECCRKFAITSDTTQRYVSRQLRIPKRCRQCRSRRKRKHAARQLEPAAPAFIREYPHNEAKPWCTPGVPRPVTKDKQHHHRPEDDSETVIRGAQKTMPTPLERVH